VVAFQKNLVAAANAHHLMTDCVEACGGIASAQEREDGEAEKESLSCFTAGSGPLRSWIRICHRLFA
jgi:hypothetical protein